MWKKMSQSRESFVYLRPNNSGPINADGLFIASYTLGIIYAVIARGTTILTHYASCHGNFSEVAQQVLKTVSPDEDSMMTYASGEWVIVLCYGLLTGLSLSLSLSLSGCSYMYHCVCRQGVVYMCITDDVSPRLCENVYF